MIRSLKIVIVGGLLFWSGMSSRAQDVVQPDGGHALQGLPATDDMDYSLLLPVDIGDVNGLTDRFGMPLMRAVPKGRFAESMTVEDEGAGNPQPAPRAAFSRATTKRNAAKAKDVKAKDTKAKDTKAKDTRRTSRTSATRSGGAAPQYHIPHGSLEWAPGEMMIDTSPSNRYGYGYGTSGYGTEVFGDFWKGWPMVE